MGRIRIMRTTAFRLTEELLGSVYVYRAGEALGSAWRRATEQWRRSPRAQLPYRSLAAALRVTTGDFVALQRRVERDRCLIISRRPIERAWLQDAIAAWELVALGHDAPGAISGYLDDLEEERVEIAGIVRRRTGASPILEGDNWPWTAARWEVAHRLAASALETDAGGVRLRLDSEACLLTWDDRVPPGDAHQQAMHKIEPRVITLPGVEAPVVSLQASLVRLTTRWFKPRHVWAEAHPDQPLLYADVDRRRAGEDWHTRWADRAGELLDRLNLAPLPALGTRPTLDGPLRTGLSVPPAQARVGRGVGPVFHEAVAHHGRQLLREARPVMLERQAVGAFPTRDRLAPRAAERLLPPETHPPVTRVWVVYATAAARKRFRDLLPAFVQRQLGEQAPGATVRLAEQLRHLEDSRCVRLGSLEIGFVSPPESERHLLAANDRATLERWLQTWWPEVAPSGSPPTALMVETLPAAEREGIDRGRDPKPLLRRLLAKRDAVTQFFAADSAPPPQKGRAIDAPPDHAAANAVIDLLRSAGFFLRRFPSRGVEPGTLLVGVYSKADRSGSSRQKQPFFISLVAVIAGSTEALGYVPGEGWLGLGQATTRYLAAAPQHHRDTAKAEIEKAVGQLHVRYPDRKVALYFDAYGCRRHWHCLADSGTGSAEGWMTMGKTAVVRVRAQTDELPRIAGQHGWTDVPAPALHTAFRPVTVADPDGHAATLLVSGSSVMDRTQEARKVSRFAASDRGLRQDWHSLNATEFLVLDPGEWEESAMIRQALALCRGAPTWERVLRWPVPLHLARAIVRDHPGSSGEEENDVA